MVLCMRYCVCTKLVSGILLIGYSSISTRNSTSKFLLSILQSESQNEASTRGAYTCQSLTSKRWVLGWGCPSVHMHLHWCTSWLWSSCQATCCCQFLQVPPSYLAGDWSGRSGCLAPHRSTDIGQQLPPTLQASEEEQGETKWSTFKSSFIYCSHFQVHQGWNCH